MRVMKISQIKNQQIFKFLSHNFRNFATYNTKIAIIGAGTGGLAVSSQLVSQGVVNSKDIALFDSASIHYYQPGYTKLGGGIIDDIKEVEYNVEDLTKDYNFQNVAVKSINPEHNNIVTDNGDVWNYEQLVIASGLQVKLDSIPGINFKKIIIHFFLS
jgi:sulfide:quinone oxidoreductase